MHDSPSAQSKNSFYAAALFTSARRFLADLLFRARNLGRKFFVIWETMNLQAHLNFRDITRTAISIRG
jgi:hypothetical protein